MYLCGIKKNTLIFNQSVNIIPTISMCYDSLRNKYAHYATFWLILTNTSYTTVNFKTKTLYMNQSIFRMVLLAAFFIQSCTKDINIDSEILTPDPPIVSVTNNLLERSIVNSTGIEMECFKVIYPFSLLSLDGSKYLVTSDEDFNKLNQDSNFYNIEDFEYPINIIGNETALTTALNNKEDLINAFTHCFPIIDNPDPNQFPCYLINEDNSCFTLHYPITIKNEKGSVLTVATEAELNLLIANELNYFVFPLKLNKEDGTLLTIYNIDGFFDALISCNSIKDSIIDWNLGNSALGCYDFQFPVSVKLNDASIKTLSDIESFNNIILQGKLEAFLFPLTLIKDDGTLIVANTQAEFDTFIEDCNTTTETTGTAFILFFVNFDSLGNAPCYTINYPITLELIGTDSNNVSTKIVADDNAFFEVLISQGFVAINVRYPVFVTKKDNTLVEIKSDNDLYTLIDECN